MSFERDPGTQTGRNFLQKRGTRLPSPDRKSTRLNSSHESGCDDGPDGFAKTGYLVVISGGRDPAGLVRATR
jgi:hypothetical protein